MSAHILNRQPDTSPFFDSASGSGRILLVSRDIDTRILIRRELFHLGYLVLEASNQLEAAVVYTMMKSEIDLVIVDDSAVQPSTLGQWHLTKHLLSKLLILLEGPAAPLESVASDTAVKCLRKPFTAEQIANAVRSVIDSHKQKKKILLVDDDASLRRMLAAALESSGFRVAQASDGREALSSANALEADIILTEIVMPEVEGLQLIQELLKVKPCLKIISMSGVECAEGYLYIARRLGAKGSITKPVNIGELLQLLDELLSNN